MEVAERDAGTASPRSYAEDGAAPVVSATPRRRRTVSYAEDDVAPVQVRRRDGAAP